MRFEEALAIGRVEGKNITDGELTISLDDDLAIPLNRIFFGQWEVVADTMNDLKRHVHYSTSSGTRRASADKFFSEADFYRKYSPKRHKFISFI